MSTQPKLLPFPMNQGGGEQQQNTVAKFAQEFLSINAGLTRESSGVFNHNVNTFQISGHPIELTIECDYKNINVSGICHRLYIIGVCNKVNLTGDLHSIYFDGFSNEVNFMSSAPSNQGKCAIWGDDLKLNCKLGFTNANFILNSGPKPKKHHFPSKLSDAKRHRFMWVQGQLFPSEKFMELTPPKEAMDSGDEELDWEECEQDDNKVPNLSNV